MKHKKQPTIQQLEATNEVCKLRTAAKNDDVLAEELGMSKATMYTRLKVSNWKKPEISHINSIKLF